MIELRSQQGETVDLICRRAYGHETSETVAATLNANPGLAALGPILPLGTVVRLPDPPSDPPRRVVVRLWD